ncbi:hypothetical protein B0A50_08567 [Salinomyces thailandicus]|uniref:Uncharacterized protein n=1 Tax=Salinomyces thailandicus TaxID=706561 RepID=A0A4V5N372_9PEZI|nr:hypothetical protein B0A50_08567 [Salinomyces thailandica]
MQESHTPQTSPLSLPSSPPVIYQGSNLEMSSAGQKRSGEQMQDDFAAVDSSATVTGDTVDLSASQDKPSSSQVNKAGVVAPSTAAHSSAMLPPATPKTGMAPPPKIPPQSKQSAQKEQKVQPAPAAKPSWDAEAASMPTDQEQAESDTTIPDDEDSSGSETPGDPNDNIADFEWGDLERRYHKKMTDLDTNEHKIMGDFNALCSFFAVWAETSRTHEVDRSFKRLKTQTAFVQHQEHELQQKRDHYVKVVDAFRSALQLLGN